MKTERFNAGSETLPFRQGHFSFVCEWLQQVSALDALLARFSKRTGCEFGRRTCSGSD